MGDTVAEVPSEAVQEGMVKRSTPEEDVKCTVCMGAEFSQECRVHGCQHSFCFSCISEWVFQALRPSCPMCRQDVDKVSYDFKDHLNGRIEIFIKEYRANQLALSDLDKSQMIGERRLVVRNLVYAYKLKFELASAIEEQDAAAETDETLKKALVEVLEDVNKHLHQAEAMLAELRTDLVHKDKAIVCNRLAFRRIIYTQKIRVKYPDLKRPKLLAADIAQTPERFRGFITDFLVAEFEFIPVQAQPNAGGFKWNTKFLGNLIDDNQKRQFASQIYEMMMNTRPGNEMFQKLISDILPNIAQNDIAILDDHLEAILSVESTNYTDFYKQVYYDSIYNSYSTYSTDLHGMMNAMRMREGDAYPFESMFTRRGEEWLNERMMTDRMIRQMFNDRTDRTDRATNNDDSDRSESPEERVPTPMPGDAEMVARAEAQHGLFSFTQQLQMRERDYEQILYEPPGFEFHAFTDAQGRQQAARIRRGVTREEAVNSLRAPQNQEQNRPATRREERQSPRVRAFDRRSDAFSNMFHQMPVLGDPTDPTARRRMITLALPRGATGPPPTIPIYLPSNPAAASVPPFVPGPREPPPRDAMERQFREVAEMLRRRDRETREAAAAAAAPPTAPTPTAPTAAPSTSEPRVTFNGDEMEIEFEYTHDLDLLDSLQRTLGWGTMVDVAVTRAAASDIPVHSSVPPPARPLSSATVRPLPTSSLRPSAPAPRTRFRNPPTRIIPTHHEMQSIRESFRGRTQQQVSEERSVADIAASIDRADADAGLDYISVAHRTRAARRAAASGQLPGTPAPKRPTNPRRD